MNYEQSLNNIEVLKNLVCPWDTDYFFFDFKTDTEFEIIFFDKENSHKIEEFLPVKYNAKLPIAHLHENKSGHEIFYYHDSTIHYQYNLSTNHILMNDARVGLRSCPIQMNLEIAALVFKLENM